MALRLRLSELRRAAPWLGVALLLGGPALLLQPADPLALRLLTWRPERVLDEPWRCWSAAWVHLTPEHRWMDLVALGAVALGGAWARLPRQAAWAWAAAWPLLHLSLLLQPTLRSYAGLSGAVLAGLAVWAIVWAADRQRPSRQRLIGLALGLALLLKIACIDQPWARVLYRPEGGGFDVAPLAHAAGVFWGGLLGLLGLLAAREPRPGK